MQTQGKRTHWISRGALSAALLAGLSHSSRVSANTEETVTSRVSGGTPYLIVHKDEEGGSRRAPGLYVREGDRGNWAIAIPSQVLSPTRTGGFSLQLNLTARTQRSEAIAVLNKKLTLFSVLSRADKPDSFVAFGGEDGTKPVDTATGNEIEVPLIDSLDDLSLFHKEVIVGEKPIEIVLASLRSKSPLGDGITFALALDSETNKNEKMALRYTPVLLDWKFRDNEAISRLLIATGTGNAMTGFFSANLTRRLSQAQESDPLPVMLWRKRIGEYVPGRGEATLRPQLPLLRITDGKIDIQELPTIPLQEGNLRALAVYDPVNQQHRVLVDATAASLSSLSRTRPFLTGAVDCSSDNCLRVTTVQSQASDSHYLSFVQLHDGTVHALTVAHNLPAAVRITPTSTDHAGKTPKSISWFAIPNSQFVIGSWLFTDNSSLTSLYRLEAGAGFLRIVSQATLCNQFMTPKQIEWRVTANALSTKARVTFDILTENVAEQDRYKELHNKHLPVLDLQDTLEQKTWSWYYPEPLQKVTVSPRVRHMRFEPANNVPNPTGFFTGDEESRKPLMGAQLLSPGSADAEEPEWTLDEMPVPVNQTRVHVAGLLVDAHFRNGTTASILLALSPESRDYPPVLLKLTSHFNQKDLKHFHFLRTPKRKEREGKGGKPQPSREPLIVGFASFKDRTEVYSVPITGLAVDGGVKTGTTQHWRINDAPLSQNEIDSRMRFVDGEPYFVTTPQLADDEREYALISPRNGSTLMPNKDPGHRVMFDDFDDEDKARYGRTFESWRVWGSDKRFREITDRVKNAAEYDLDVFPDFSKLLEDMATPGTTPRHVLFIVPAPLKAYTQDYPFAILTRQQKGRLNFHAKNTKLQLYLPDPDKAKQSDVVANLRGMNDRNASPSARAVLISTLDMVTRIGRPTADHEVNFTVGEETIRESELSGVMDADQLPPKDSSTETPADHPHLMYWLANEGDQVPLSKFDPKRKAKSPIILIGTDDEVTKLKEQAKLEENRNLFDHFEIVELSQSTQEIRQSMIRRVFESKEFRELGYQIDVTDIDRDRKMDEISQDEARDILCRHMANRIDALAAKHDVPVFTAFMRVVSTLTNQLSNNAKLRKGGVVSRGVTEEILAKVFPIPLHLDLLPPDDPLRKLSSPEFVLHWQQSGYDGPITLRRQVIRTVLAQLGNDTVRPVPSSIILYGTSGSGKTFLTTSLFGSLGLRRYKFDGSAEDNQQAQAFFLDVNRIVENYGASETTPDSLTVQQAMEHFDNFVASPHGARGFICLDDFHTAPTKAREIFLKKIRTILESPYYVANGRQIPTRNMTIIITMNATDDQSKIEKYTSDKVKGPTDAEVILATLNDANQTNIEKSLLRRFGLILNLERFPTSAKGPALIRATATAAQGLFTNSGRYVLVTPTVVSGLVGQFPDVNARSFLSAGANALIQVEDRSDNRSYIVVPNPDYYRLGSGLPLSTPYETSGQKEEADIERYVRAAVQKLPISATPVGKLQLLNFLVNNFRTKLFEVWLRGISEDSRYFENPDYHSMISIPLAQAIHDHLASVPEYPLDWLVLSYSELGSSNPNERFGFDAAFQQLRAAQRRPMWTLPSVGTPPRSDYLRSLVEGTTMEIGQTRQHVLRDQIEPLQALARDALHKWLYVDTLETAPETEAWLEALPASDMAARTYERKWLADLGTHLSDRAVRFVRTIHQASVSRLAKGPEPLSQYDAFRLLCLTIDRAIGRLAWGRVTSIIMDALHMATGKLMLGESRGVQQLLFTGKSSPLIAMEGSFVRQMARNLPDYGEPEEDVTRIARHVRFVANCGDFLATAGDQGARQ